MSSFASTCAAALQKEGVIGAMCVDANGLALHSEGTVPEGCSGAVAELASQSFALVGDDAVVTAEAPKGKVLISRSEGVTIALFMQPAA
uniref:Late endosomal/lysosomal adaptor and MAPK and MTOR activator 5 n=1 Tax=Haptolina brevifila TaxID=156173 RepID=A0A7S2I5N1_9EUKA